VVWVHLFAFIKKDRIRFQSLDDFESRKMLAGAASRYETAVAFDLEHEIRRAANTSLDHNKDGVIVMSVNAMMP
jgi:hypothetical protein